MRSGSDRSWSSDVLRPSCVAPVEGRTIEHAPAACCCYTVDEGYLLPTLVSALQLRRILPEQVADVVVVCFGPSSEVTASCAALCTDARIRFVSVPAALLDGAPTLCARFFLPAVLESRYRRIVYLDGDTQVSGSPEPLLSRATASGVVLAAPDPMAVMIEGTRGPWPARRAYFERIGVPSHRRATYFNSGVLAFERTDWEAISRECLALCAARGDAFTFHDQDALNLVVGDNHRAISFRWNFPPFFMNFGAHEIIKPCIYHFMSNPRPWHGAFAPWGRRWHDPYLAFAAAHPALARSMPRIGRLRRLKYIAQQRFKRLTEARAWGTSAVRTRIADLEARAIV